MPTRIILIVLKENGRPYMGEFDSTETIYPKPLEKGGLGHPPMHPDDCNFLIAMARQTINTGKIWLPADSHRDPPGCFVPYWLTEAIWCQLETGPGCYYKFIFNPPLEIVHDLPPIDDPYR